jgi:hypothetical protein
VQNAREIGREFEGCFSIPHDNPPRWLFVLTAYLDESGQESTDYVFIAGFLGNDEQWKRCADDWRIGLGKRKGLHMKKLRWAYPKKIEKLLARLGPIPHNCGLKPLLGGVRVSDYQDLVGGDIRKKVMAGYMAALYPLVIQMLKVVPCDERVEIVFEAQDQYQASVNIMLSNLVKCDPQFLTADGSPKLANWKFVPKDSTLLTQPADYFAYAVTQIYRDEHSEKTKLCMPICPDGPKSTAIGAVMTRHQVRGIVQLTHNLATLQALSGVNLHPRTSEEREQFNAMVREFISGRPHETE